MLALLLAVCTTAPALDTLRLRPDERILIIAPHPDDEVLACGGLIQQALDIGDSVWIVYLTNGDGAWPSVTEVTGRIFPCPADYVALGRARMLEARRATALLGLDSSRLSFLGYPDANLVDLWTDNWHAPRRSSYTAEVSSPYGTGREYTGRNLLNDLVGTLKRVRPTMVFSPHECDAHPDHWAAAGFLDIARATWQDSAAFPPTYSYLIHRRPWPEANATEDGSSSPPNDLRGDRHHWFSLPLTDEQTTLKTAAYEENGSQLNLVDEYLYGLAGPNELFDLQPVADSVVTDDAPTLRMFRVGRLDTLAVTRGESLAFRARLRAGPSDLLCYRLVLHAVSEMGAVSPSDLELRVEESDVLSTTVPRPALGTLFYSLEVKLGSRLINHSGIGRIVY